MSEEVENVMTKEEPQTAGLAVNKKMDWIRIGVYLGITFVITYLFEILVVWPVSQSADLKIRSLTQTLMALAMFIPAIGVILTRLFTKEGFKNAWILPKQFKKTFRYYIYAWFIFALLIVLGAAVFYLIFPDYFDLKMSYMIDMYAQSGTTITSQQLLTTIIVQGVVGLFLAPLLNFINCFGEEWGWRGYLLPKTMGKMPVIPMLLMNGVIWGLWHAPLTAIGHNYGVNYTGFPYVGILAMCLFCVSVGSILSYFCWKAKSCLPGVIGHASLNGLAAFGICFLSKESNPLLGPSVTGIIGGSVMFIVAAICAVLMQKDAKTS